MSQIKFCVICFCVLWATGSLAAEPIGFGLTKKYCLGDVCLGDSGAMHSELKAGAALKKAVKYKDAPICRVADASVNIREVRFNNGSEGSVGLHADPVQWRPQVDQYFRISSVTVKFSPFLSAEGVKQLEQKIAGRYSMVRATAYSYEVVDGKRIISLTVAPWESRLVVSGFDNAEFLAQPGCESKIPSL